MSTVPKRWCWYFSMTSSWEHVRSEPCASTCAAPLRTQRERLLTTHPSSSQCKLFYFTCRHLEKRSRNGRQNPRSRLGSEQGQDGVQVCGGGRPCGRWRPTPAWRDLAKSAVNRGGTLRAETPGFWSYSLAGGFLLAPRTKLRFTELWQPAGVHRVFMRRRCVVLECGCAGWFFLQLSMPWKLQWDSSSFHATVNGSPLDSAPSVAGQSSSFCCLSAVNCSDRSACTGAFWKLPQVFRDRAPHHWGGSEILSKTWSEKPPFQ